MRIVKAESDDSEDLIGITLAGRFLLEHKISDGGSGAVWLGRDLENQRLAVAVKLIRSSGPNSNPRWQTELKALEKLNHPGIVQPRSGGVSETLGPYLVTEYVEGITLQTVLARGAVPHQWVLSRVWELCDALEYAHGRGVLHCDLKPNNIMIRHYGDAGACAVLIDFGVAVLRDGDHSTTVYQNAEGALDYMAPEQLEGKLSNATDIYALAAIVFEALTGARWRQAQRDGRWEAALGEMPYLVPLFRTALDVNPKLRYGSVAAFREAFRAGWE